MTDIECKKKILICESYQGMRDAFELMLGKQYELIFAGHPEQMKTLLIRHSVELLIWDLDEIGNSVAHLKSIRKVYPGLKTLLIAGEFDVDYQIAIIQECGLTNFLTKPWESSFAVIERIQIMLGDRESPIHQRVLKVPLVSQGHQRLRGMQQ